MSQASLLTTLWDTRCRFMHVVFIRLVGMLVCYLHVGWYGPEVDTNSMELIWTRSQYELEVDTDLMESIWTQSQYGLGVYADRYSYGILYLWYMVFWGTQ